MKCVNISAKGDDAPIVAFFETNPTRDKERSGAGGERRRGRSSRERIRATSVASSVIQEWLCRLVGPPIYTHAVRKTALALSLPSLHPPLLPCPMTRYAGYFSRAEIERVSLYRRLTLHTDYLPYLRLSRYVSRTENRREHRSPEIPTVSI